MVMWALILAAINLYIIYIVWSAAEEIANAPFPGLAQHRDRLKDVHGPVKPSGPYPLPVGRAEPMPGADPPPSTMKPEQAAGPGPRNLGVSREPAAGAEALQRWVAG